MNYVYLSPHFPTNFKHFCIQLSQLGVRVLGISEAPYDELQPELREALTEYYRVDNMLDYDQLVRALGYFTHRFGKIDRIDSLNEFWLETEARLRVDFNIYGTKLPDIYSIKRKSRMKAIYESAGVPVARGRVVHTLEEGKRFAAEVGFPVVVKPDIGVGAAATYKLANEHELEYFFATKPPVEYIMEEFVDGVIHSFDGLVDYDGQLRFYTAHRYGEGIMETVNEDKHVYYYSLREIPADLEECGRRVLKAFDVRAKFFHFEFFRTHRDGRIVALEVNMRPPGGWTTDMFNFANDIDVYREWANVMVHNRFEANYSRPYHCFYIGRKSNKNYVHSHEDILKNYGDLIVHHEPVAGVFSPALGNYGYLARSPHLDQLQALVGYIHQLR